MKAVHISQINHLFNPKVYFIHFWAFLLKADNKLQTTFHKAIVVMLVLLFTLLYG